MKFGLILQTEAHISCKYYILFGSERVPLTSYLPLPFLAFPFPLFSRPVLSCTFPLSLPLYPLLPPFSCPISGDNVELIFSQLALKIVERCHPKLMTSYLTPEELKQEEDMIAFEERTTKWANPHVSSRTLWPKTV